MRRVSFILYPYAVAKVTEPEVGKRFDLSADTNTNTGLTDSSVFLYPTNGYGDADLIRHLIDLEKPDAIMLITDPRYFEWLFAIENEIRKHMPIIYLNIWDDYPAPLYNKAFYESCDALLAISKQTKLINELVLDETGFGIYAISRSEIGNQLFDKTVVLDLVNNLLTDLDNGNSVELYGEVYA